MKAKFIMVAALTIAMFTAALETSAQSRNSNSGSRQARTSVQQPQARQSQPAVGHAQGSRHATIRHTTPFVRPQHIVTRPVALAPAVERPWAIGTVLTELPVGYTTVVIDGRDYYTALGMTFEAVLLDGLLHFRVVA